MPSDMSHPAVGAGPVKRLPLPEFIGLLAMLFATIAFSIDSMLPSFPKIAQDLSPQDPNRVQLVITIFMLGMGLGTLFAGPISDAIGRKVTITGGIAIYIIAALTAWRAESLEMLLAARFLQGIGASGPRIVAVALVRDLYQGREMARVTSLVMMIFILVPAVAPSLGAAIMAFTGWRGIFLAFVIFALCSATWLNLRQAETLEPARRRPLNLRGLVAGAREVLGDREVRIYTLTLTLGQAQMFATISSAQQLFDTTYHRAASFPLWFAGMALLAGVGSMLNARFVVRLGMRRIVIWAYAMQTVVSAAMVALTLSGALAGTEAGIGFAVFFFWMTSLFFMIGVTFGNLNALALQKMGHLAGMAASVVGCISTVCAVVLAVPVGLAFDGTDRPLVLATLACSGIALLLMRRTRVSG
ncbi:multidrug effflux MFS transporter [Frigidibacter sp. MR17.14]|uniref:multidrug effflux MFS transporter n=1 Tax=Frigidibacter sp. MR17.14 TaxID=3126509 RepID=UPI00301300AF